MSFGSVIVVLVLVEAVALVVALRWLLVGVRAAVAPPVPALQPIGAVAPTPPAPRPAPVSHRAITA